MSTGRLSDDARQRRDQIEDALANLHGLPNDLEELRLRIHQAMRRTPLVNDVLEPADQRIIQIYRRVRHIQATLGSYWTQEQTRKWKP